MQLNLIRNKAGSMPRTSGMCETERYKSACKEWSQWLLEFSAEMHSNDSFFMLWRLMKHCFTAWLTQMARKLEWVCIEQMTSSISIDLCKQTGWGQDHCVAIICCLTANAYSFVQCRDSCTFEYFNNNQERIPQHEWQLGIVVRPLYIITNGVTKFSLAMAFLPSILPGKRL